MPDPIVFDGCSGWYHPGAETLGVVMCAPHGYEELCVHRHWRQLAQALADRGLPTLRFDYPGTGDSLGDDQSPGQVEAWIDSIKSAIRALQERAGVGRVALVGLRIGALLATVAAEQLGGVAALVLLAPIASGENCFRELRALAMLRAAGRHRSAAAVSEDGRLEAAGFLYMPETLSRLRALPVLQSGRAPARTILILNRPNAAPDRDFLTRLRDTGTPVREEVFEDYPLLLRDADASAYPERGFGCAVDWLAGLCGQEAASAASNAIATVPNEPVPPVLKLPESRETAVFLKNGKDLFGIVCEPDFAVHQPVLVFLNTGANHHIGSSRMTVTMARRFAQDGFTSLRFDIGGVGDSNSRPGQLAYQPDPLAATADIRSALDWLQAKGHDEFVVIGLCSGATLGLKATLRDNRIVGQILLNLQGVWKTSDPTDQYASRRTYLRLAGSPFIWKRALRGEIDLWGIARSIVCRAVYAAYGDVLELWNKLRGRMGRRGASLAEFRGLAARGVKTCFVYVEEDPGLDELEMMFGSDGQLLADIPNVSMTFLKEGDHIFSWDHSRRQLFAAVEQKLAWIVKPRQSRLPLAHYPGPGNSRQDSLYQNALSRISHE